MRNRFDSDEFTATNMRIALNENFSEATYSAISVIDQYELLEAYLAFDDGALAEAPHALDAYIGTHICALNHFGLNERRRS